MGVKKPNAAASPKKGGPKDKGGAKKGRKLLRWNDSHEKRLLLSIQFCCSEKGIVLPWDMIGEYVEGVSAGAIQQHLAKMRQRLQEWGSDVPPPLRRGTPHTSSFVAERINHAPGASITRQCKQRGMPKMPNPSKSAPKKRAPAKDKHMDYFDNTEDELDEPELKREDEIIGDTPDSDTNDDDVVITNDRQGRVPKKETRVKDEVSDYDMDSDSDGLYNPPSVDGGKRKRASKSTAARPLSNARSARTQSTRRAAKKARSMTKAGLQIIEQDESYDESEVEESEEDTSQSEEDDDTEGENVEDAPSRTKKSPKGNDKISSPITHHAVRGVEVPKKIVGLELADPRYSSPRFPRGLMHWPSGESGVTEIADRNSGHRKRGNFGYHPEKNGEDHDFGAFALGYYPPNMTGHASETVPGLGNAPFYQPPLSFEAQPSPAVSNPVSRQGSNFYAGSLFTRKTESGSPKMASPSEYSDNYFNGGERTIQAAKNSLPLRTADYTSSIDRNEQIKQERQSMMVSEEAESYLNLDIDHLFDADLENYQ